MGRTKRRDSTAGPEEKAAAMPEKKEGRRKKRSRPIPKWLKESNELDAIAQRRCLMLLSALSGERPVSDVIEQLQISRGTYYQLEERAVRAMLGAMMPGASDVPQSAAIPGRRIAELETQVQKLEQDKRRLERVLHLTRRVLKPGPVTTPSGTGRPRGRPRKAVSSSGDSGSSASPVSTTKKSSSTTPPETPLPENASTASPISGGAAG